MEKTQPSDVSREETSLKTPNSPTRPQDLAVKTIFISTGEVSGDLQGALLIDALKRQAAVLGWELEIVALGGPRMAAAGARLLGDTTAIGSVGILESLPFVLPTLKVQRYAKQYLLESPPDLVLLIDYMGPNLGIGTFLEKRFPQVPVVYYIAPQEWVWSVSPRNTAKIVSMSNLLLAIFPEEARYFQKKGAAVSWVGHPLVDKMQAAPSRTSARKTLGIEPEQLAIALIPASRQQELKYLMPVIFEAAKQLQAHLSPQSSITAYPPPTTQDILFWIPLSMESFRRPIEEASAQYGLRAKIVSGQTQEALAAADLAIAKSGTVNLELALLDVPQVVLYRVNPITAWVGHNILKFSIPFMSPPNLVEMRSVVPELLQEQATPENILKEALSLLDPEKRATTLADYQDMRRALGEVGVCDRAAHEVLQLISQS